MTLGAFTPVPSPLRAAEYSLSLRLPSSVNLATQAYSLARYSKRTLEHRSALARCRCQISGSFNSLLWVLFNFPSRYFSSIGLKTYLGLEVDASQVPAQYPMCGTQELARFSTQLLLRGFHPLWPSVSGEFGFPDREPCRRSYNTTSFTPCGAKFSLPSAAFTRCY